MEDFVKQSSIVPRNFTYKPGPLIFWQFNSNQSVGQLVVQNSYLT